LIFVCISLPVGAFGRVIALVKGFLHFLGDCSGVHLGKLQQIMPLKGHIRASMAPSPFLFDLSVSVDCSGVHSRIGTRTACLWLQAAPVSVVSLSGSTAVLAFPLGTCPCGLCIPPFPLPGTIQDVSGAAVVGWYLVVKVLCSTSDIILLLT